MMGGQYIDGKPSNASDNIRRRTVLEKTTASVLFGIPGAKGARIQNTKIQSNPEKVSDSDCKISKSKIKRGN